MAILSSSESIRRVSSNPQVPLVIISQPLPGPVTGQTGSPVPQPTADQSGADSAIAATSDLVFELDRISTEPEEPPLSTVASLPVADQITREDVPTPGEEQTVGVS